MISSRFESSGWWKTSGRLAEATFVPVRLFALEARTRLDSSIDASQHLAGINALVEDQNRRLAISPGREAEQLIDGLSEGLGPLPELAIGDENVAITPRAAG